MNLIERVKNILVKPKEEWLVINGESNSGMPLVTTYLLPLAIVAALAVFLGYGIATKFESFLLKYGLIWALIMLLQLALSVYINAIITDALAPSFSSEKNLNKSIQLIVYSSTPLFIGSILYIIPRLGWLGALAGAIYSIYLLYLGLSTMKKTPEDKVPIYLLLIIIVQGVLYWLVGYILTRILISSFFEYPGAGIF